MSQFIANIHSYDVMDRVTYSARVRRYDSDQDDSGELVLHVSSSFPGEGVDEPQQWLKDCLVALIEML